jgi:NADH-quinone oxidoreductase subunit B
MIATACARHDLARFGMEVFRPTPRQSDLMIVAGTVTNKMAGPTKILYEQMPDPKFVIAMGSCACSGGVFDTYGVLQGVDRIIPVDVYVPGCPVRPESLLFAVIKLQEKIMEMRHLRKLKKVEKRESYIITGPNTYETVEGKPVSLPTSLIEKIK